MMQPRILSDESATLDGTPDAVRERVACYYDALQVLYSMFWSRTGVHYGFWERGTWRRARAVRNMDALVAAELRVRPGARVLDAGCGVGGTSLFLAERHGVETVGITISDVQLARAQRLAARSQANPHPVFRKADYLRTPFPDGAFDGVVAIESACYAAPKSAFLREMHRILRKGGRLVVLDGFRQRPLSPGGEQLDFQRFLDGLSLDDLADIREFCATLEAVGFKE